MQLGGMRIFIQLLNKQWVIAEDCYVEAFKNFSKKRNFERKYTYDNGLLGENKIKFTIERMHDRKILLTKENGTQMPIIDYDNVKVFLLDQDPVNWYQARNYQSWAYFDFVYSGESEKYYASYNSTTLKPNINYTQLPIQALEANIIFKMSRNENGGVFFEKNDISRTRVKISDCEPERMNYLGLYHRMTEQLFSVHLPPQTIQPSQQNFTIPQVIVVKTDNDEEMCVVCNTIKHNVRLIPCNHTNTCSECIREIILHNQGKTTPAKCPICRSGITQILPLEQKDKTPKKRKIVQSNDWFECAFGFKELNYTNAKLQFEHFFAINIEQFNGIKIGKFNLVSNGSLNDKYQYKQNPQQYGNVSLKNISGNIQEIHKTSTLSNNATIQVASQFNCLEMINPNVTPEDGITMYMYDKTQGPICAMSTPAGTAYRNYIYNGGQTKTNQMDTTKDLLLYFQSKDPSISWKMQNGYLIFDNDKQLKKINRVLISNPQTRREARQKIMSGSHIDQGIFINCQDYDHTVNHVYCSGLPISYNYAILNHDLWDGFAELVLEAMYENTLMIACDNNIRTGENRPCYLTMIGGGAFKMKHEQIIRAIQRACNIIAYKGLNLDVIVVHYGNISEQYKKLPTQYPVHADVNSVWDDEKWFNTAFINKC